MSELPVIENIRRKVARLIADNESLRRERDAVAADCDKLRRDNLGLAGRVRELDKQIAAFELIGGLSGTANDRKRAKARINRLMREVDRCIVLLNGE